MYVEQTSGSGKDDEMDASVQSTFRVSEAEKVRIYSRVDRSHVFDSRGVSEDQLRVGGEERHGELDEWLRRSAGEDDGAPAGKRRYEDQVLVRLEMK